MQLAATWELGEADAAPAFDEVVDAGFAVCIEAATHARAPRHVDFVGCVCDRRVACVPQHDLDRRADSRGYHASERERLDRGDVIHARRALAEIDLADVLR